MATPIKNIVFIALMAFPGFAHSETSFQDVWSKIRSNSPLPEAARLQQEAVSEGQQRASRHWLPKVYLDARSYNTNDPGSSLFGLLSQREIKQTDFIPDNLNNPDSQTFTRGALGLDLALYEGGMKSNQVDMFEHSLKSQQHVSSQVETELYAKVGQLYGSISVVNAQIEKLQAIDLEISKLIRNYQIGQKSNPVGYSGLLGMKSLSNRISGLIEQYQSQQKAFSRSLFAMGWDQESWSPQKMGSTTFVEKFLSSSAGKAESAKLKAGYEGAKAASEMAEMERARYLPRVGAFAESYVFNGTRGTANGYTAGLYLQWNLFDAADFGKYKEAKINAMASEKMTQAMAQQEEAEYFAAQEADRAMRANLKLLENSDKLLNEQMQVATTLFKNGSISALQLVEILNRRTDLISQQGDLQLGLIKNASESVTKTAFQIPFQGNGERK
ncbi:MAG: hypothetical protein OM95_15870 [Bdellovibrio sp. ArHS]|uniref:TolC family protein n=1 Tax=Bdellovibrio sp. ArHS TaxID=1569284 RepID=UPI0005828A7C|nr:TolC family protein [Bdellovibrio sp. ArHS]KHD87172.1 MAG: hypothetical protein OM95_15870 [Bdellovibrio sp. ArHS]